MKIPKIQVQCNKINLTRINRIINTWFLINTEDRKFEDRNVPLIVNYEMLSISVFIAKVIKIEQIT